ncbi:tail needle knob protein [Escherichia coli]|uniref:tail needle knob protein n=1 Tax=Escherichia coli TaxID=562 RepID=UPI003D6D08C8
MTDNFYAPPHSIEAEQAVIGGLLLDDDSSERVQKVLAMLKPDSFYSRPHKILFEEITRMHREQKPVDGLTLFDELERKSLTASVGGFAYIAEIAKNTPSAANIVAYAMQVRESEVVYSGVSVTIPTAPTNLVSLLKTFTPSSGTLAPFFDTVNNKMVVFNENKTLFFKLSIVGTWPSGTANRSMQLTFSGSVPDTLVSSRNAATTTDNILLATFFSVDKDGFLATNGSTLTIQSNGAAFTATTIKIIAEQ